MYVSLCLSVQLRDMPTRFVSRIKYSQHQYMLAYRSYAWPGSAFEGQHRVNCHNSHFAILGWEPVVYCYNNDGFQYTFTCVCCLHDRVLYMPGAVCTADRRNRVKQSTLSFLIIVIIYIYIYIWIHAQSRRNIAGAEKTKQKTKRSIDVKRFRRFKLSL